MDLTRIHDFNDIFACVDVALDLGLLAIKIFVIQKKWQIFVNLKFFVKQKKVKIV